MKVCSRCKRTKPHNDFGRNRTCPDGFMCWCKACCKENNQLPRVKKRNRARTRQYAKRHEQLARARNPRFYRHMGLVKWANYRAKQRGASGHVSFKDWRKILETYDYKCLACGSEKPGIDHVIPISLEGENTADNLQPLCISCNARKGQKSTDYRLKHQESA